MSLRSRRLWAYGSLYLVWGSTYPAIRYAVRWVPPLLLAGARLLPAGLLLLGLARLRGTAWPSRRQWLGSAALGLVFMVACNAVATWGLQYIAAGRATLLTACVPLVALAYGALARGRRLDPARLALLGLGLAGVALLLGPEARTGPHPGWGLAAILWAVTLWGITMVESTRFEQSADRLMASGVQLAAAGLLLLALVPAFAPPAAVDWGALPWTAWAAWAYLSLVGSCVGYLSFNWLIHHEPPHLAGTYAFVNPVVAVFLGWWLLGEPLGWRTVAASGLIVAAVAGLLWKERGGTDVALA